MASTPRRIAVVATPRPIEGHRVFLPFRRNPSAGLPRFNYTLGGFNVFVRAIRKTPIFFNERSPADVPQQAPTW